MKLILTASFIGLLLTLVTGYVVLPVLKKLKLGQTLSSSVMDTQANKQGTPTMGGVIFLSVGLLVSIVCAFFTACEGHLFLYCVFFTLTFALIGLADDALKIILRRNEGLTVKQKLVPQAGAALLFALLAYLNPDIGGSIRVPFTSAQLNLGIFYIPFTAFVIVALDNSVNLLDGLDGLCAGSSVFQFAFFGAAALVAGGKLQNTATFAFVMCACLIGYHRFNAHPARVFMGDVGSLGLGGALAALAIVTNTILFIPVVMLTAVMSSVSDIAQIVYMRGHKGRKLLRMSPIHHHFEKAGVPEERIVTAYNILTFAACLLALIALV